MSMTLSDGSNTRYLVRPPQADKKQDLGIKLAITDETIFSWELEKAMPEIAPPLGYRRENF